MITIRAHRIATCENCGSEKRDGRCLLCGEGERTTSFRLPYPRRETNVEDLIKFYLGENAQKAGEGSLW